VLAACGRLRTLTAVLRRAGDVSGNPARCTEPTMAHDPVSSVESSVLLVRDVAGTYRPAQADEVLQAAQTLLWQQMRGREVLNSPQMVRDFLRVRLGGLEHEVFAILMLDAQHALIEYVELFRGTVSQTSVYPREVVKESLARNAAALILVHNHPSGVAEPSRADEMLTQTLKSALSLVDVRVLDHLIVAGTTVLSFAESGLI
jgi:DNA repair protein RadC